MIDVLDPRCSNIKEKALKLLDDAFGGFPKDYYDHIFFDSNEKTKLLGVIDDGELVAMNGFIAHPVSRNGVASVAYQSCLSATRSDQKGKGYFSKIINSAKIQLKDDGGAFIFGFPNHNSAPIFIKKLGFSVSNNIPCIFYKNSLFGVGRIDEEEMYDSGANKERVYFDVCDVAEWKMKKNDRVFFEFEKYTNYFFGEVKVKKVMGVPVRVLLISAYEINKPMIINLTIKEAMKSANVSFLRIVANSTSAFAKSASMKRSQSLTEPVISFGLNWELEAQDIEVFAGVKDAY